MPTEWIEVRSCNWLHEAQLFKSVLEGAGIEVLIPDEYTLGVQPFYAAALGGVRILVRADDRNRAAELLNMDATTGPSSAHSEPPE
jgi:hypothetical protein